MKELNVIDIIPRERHPLIFNTFDGLGKGESFVLVNDHDPRPLHYQFIHEREGLFMWDYLEQGPERWRVKITKNEDEDTGHDREPELPIDYPSSSSCEREQ